MVAPHKDCPEPLGPPPSGAPDQGSAGVGPRSYTASSVLATDPRPILEAWTFGGHGGGWVVGQAGTTKIEAYDDLGSESFVPWIAVYAGDQVVVRIVAHQVEIHYERKQLDTHTIENE